MTKEKLIEILNSAWGKETPFIDYTENYIYALIPIENDNWKEISYDRISQDLDERIINSTVAFRMLIEEIEKGVGLELEVFMLNDFREFRNSLTGSDKQKLIATINELITNKDKYSKDFPIIKSKEELTNLLSKI